MTEVAQHESGCTCNDCREFAAWCDDTDRRWRQAEAEGRVVRPAVMAPSGLLEALASEVKR